MSYLDKNSENNVWNENNNGLLRVNLKLEEMYRYLQYIVSDSPFIADKNIRNMNKFLSKVDIDKSFPLENNKARAVFMFLKIFSELNSETAFQNSEMIRSYFKENYANKKDGIPEEVIDECIAYIDALFEDESLFFTEKEILLINKTIEDKLNYEYLIRSADSLKNLYDAISYGNVPLSDISRQAKDTIDGIYKFMRDTDTSVDLTSNKLDFTDDRNSEFFVEKTYNKVKSPTNKLKTGYRLLNTMLSGGFEGNRTYYFFAPPKSFKSGTLLNLACSVCKNNKDILNNIDPYMKPVVSYVTMENTTEETLERLYEYVSGESLKDSNKSPKEITDMIKEKISGETGISLIIEYVPSNSVTTEYLYDLMDQYKKEGKQCIMMIQDYIGRIRSAAPGIRDLRIELGAISDEFSNFAKHFGIPLITAGQLNRIGVDKKEQMEASNTPDIAKNLVASMVAESLQIIQNLDYGFTVSRETAVMTKDGSEIPLEFNGFHLIASRGKQDVESKVKYFAQPFVNGMQLVEDINSDETLGTFSIAQSIYGNEYVENEVTKNANKNKIGNKSNGRTTMSTLKGNSGIGMNGTFNTKPAFLNKIEEVPQNPMDDII